MALCNVMGLCQRAGNHCLLHEQTNEKDRLTNQFAKPHYVKNDPSRFRFPDV